MPTTSRTHPIEVMAVPNPNEPSSAAPSPIEKFAVKHIAAPKPMPRADWLRAGPAIDG